MSVRSPLSPSKHILAQVVAHRDQLQHELQRIQNRREQIAEERLRLMADLTELKSRMSEDCTSLTDVGKEFLARQRRSPASSPNVSRDDNTVTVSAAATPDRAAHENSFNNYPSSREDLVVAIRDARAVSKELQEAYGVVDDDAVDPVTVLTAMVQHVGELKQLRAEIAAARNGAT